MRIIGIVAAVGWLIVLSGWAQSIDSLQRPLNDTDRSSISPTGAVIRSLILPGWGQWYTGHPIKGLVIATAFGITIGVGMYYHTLFQQQQQEIVRYEQEFNQEPPLAMIQIREYYRDRRDEFLIYAAIVYGIAALDAYVDAHLVEFDVGENLTIGMVPGQIYWTWRW